MENVNRFQFSVEMLNEFGIKFSQAETKANHTLQFNRLDIVKHIWCSPYQASSNGEAEWSVRAFKQAMKASHQDGPTLQHQFENFLLTYQTTPHATTGEAPCTLFMGLSLHTHLDLLLPCVQKKVFQKQVQQKLQHDQYAKLRELEPGQHVLVKNTRSQWSTWISDVIVQQHVPLSFPVDVGQGHLAHLKKLPSENSLTSANSSTTTTWVSRSREQTNSDEIPATWPKKSQSQAEYCYPSRVHRSPDRYHETYLYIPDELP